MPTNGFSWFLEALSRYAEFGGRSGRREYWYFTLFNVVFSILCGIVAGALHVRPLGGLYSLAMFLPAIAVGVRRIHDVGRTGWWILLPIVNLVFCCLAGDPGPNRYGDAPERRDPRPDRRPFAA